MLFLATTWSAIGWVILGTVIFLVLVAALGRGIAAAFPPKPEHMSSFKKPVTRSAAPAVPARTPASIPALRAASDIPPEIMAVIAASVATVLQGQKYKVHNVRLAAMKTPNIEHLMTEWSMEGRRQVYSSHQIDRH